MSKPLVALTRPIPPVALAALEEYFEVRTRPDTVPSETELCEFVKDAIAIVPLLTEKITDAVLEAAGPQLKVVASYTVGFDNIDLEAANKRGIVVTHTPGHLSGIAVAEQVLGLMLAVARHMVAADQFVRAGNYKYWQPALFMGQHLSGKTVGVVGTGQIGALFAKMCHHALDMKVVYTDVVANAQIEQEVGAVKMELPELLKVADVVSLHVPLLPTTHHLIGEEQLKLMKPTAILINTARGPVVDEGALVRALQNKQIYGAGLDVFEREPELAEGLAALDQVVLTPHTASATEATRIAMAASVASDVRAVLEGKTPENIVKL